MVEGYSYKTCEIMMNLFTKLMLLACFHLMTASEMQFCVNNSDNSCQNCDKTVDFKDLQKILFNVSSVIIKKVVLCSAQVTLESEIIIENVSFIRLYTNLEMSTIECKEKVGIKIQNVNNLTIQNIAVKNCGGQYYSTSVNTSSNSTTGLAFTTSIFLLKCTNVAVSEICVTQNYGIGLTLIDCGGSVTIKNSTFSENTKYRSSNSTNVAGGNGLYIEFSYCFPGGVINGIENSTYFIEQCSFINNTAYSVKENQTSYVHPGSSNFQGLGRGGGLCIHFRGTARKNVINILNCSFIQNRAIWGAGLYVSVRDFSESNKVYIDQGRFSKNNCTLNGGGGIDVGFLFNESSHPIQNKIWFNNSEFLDNQAEYGGGALIYSSSAVNFTNLENEVEFEKCSWHNNTAIFGAAVNLGSHTWDGLKRGFLPKPFFKNCRFTSNSVDKNLTQGSIKGKGSFVAVGMDASFEGVTEFLNNNNTALYLVSSIAIFKEHSNALFQGNSGKSGGAIVILSLGSLQISDNSVFRFVNNSAREKGGAIYQMSYNVNDFIVSRSCFIQYTGEIDEPSQRNINFTFKNNRAGKNLDNTHYGNSIYAGTLKPCYSGCLQKTLTGYNDTFSCIGNFDFDERNKDFEISTVGDNGCLSTNQSISVIPGIYIEIPVTLLNELHNKVNALYHLFLTTDNKNTSITISEDYISDNLVKVFGNPGEKATLWVETVDVWEISFHINITMEECPPGFALSRNDTAVNRGSAIRCKCMANEPEPLYDGILKCSEDEEYFNSTMKSGYWYGYNTKAEFGRASELISGYCLLQYCVYHESGSITLPDNTTTTYLDILLCGKRTGKLCGRCQVDQSVFFHVNGYQCSPNKKCDLGILLYIVTEILPITLIFIAVIFLDINFTHGSINGLIFFFQVTDVSITLTTGYLQCDSPLSDMQDMYTFLTSIFNLKFFYHPKMSFCLFPGFQTLDVLAFRYITIMYSLLLVVAIISIMKAYNLKKITQKFPKFCGRSVDIKSTVIHGISGFLVMCYSEISKVSLLILTPGYLYSTNATETVVLFDGNLEYFKGGHLKYAIPALLFLIVVGLIPPLLLFSYPLCYKIFGFLKIGESKFVRALCMLIPLEKFRPFFDSFQSSFKDDYRFYSGLYFVYRFITLMAFSMTRTPTEYFTAILIIYSVILCMHAVIQPYKEKWHNVLDGLIFTNLILYHALTSYGYQSKVELLNNKNIICGFQTILLYIPVVYFLAHLIKIALKTLEEKMKFKKKVKDDSFREKELSESLLFSRRDSV